MTGTRVVRVIHSCLPSLCTRPLSSTRLCTWGMNWCTCIPQHSPFCNHNVSVHSMHLMLQEGLSIMVAIPPLLWSSPRQKDSVSLGWFWEIHSSHVPSRWCVWYAELMLSVLGECSLGILTLEWRIVFWLHWPHRSHWFCYTWAPRNARLVPLNYH